MNPKDLPEHANHPETSGVPQIQRLASPWEIADVAIRLAQLNKSSIDLNKALIFLEEANEIARRPKQTVSQPKRSLSAIERIQSSLPEGIIQHVQKRQDKMSEKSKRGAASPWVGLSVREVLAKLVIGKGVGNKYRESAYAKAVKAKLKLACSTHNDGLGPSVFPAFYTFPNTITPKEDPGELGYVISTEKEFWELIQFIEPHVPNWQPPDESAIPKAECSKKKQARGKSKKKQARSKNGKFSEIKKDSATGRIKKQSKS